MYTIYSNGTKYDTKRDLCAALGVAWCLEQEGDSVTIRNEYGREVYKS